MASDNTLMDVDPDSRRTCPTCGARMSTLLHDKHSVCVPCRGNECTFDKRCNECSSWDDEVMNRNVKHMKSLVKKSRSRAKCRRSLDAKTSDVKSRSSSGISGATPLGSGESIPASSVSEARVEELISSHMSRMSSSFAAYMEASFVNIEKMIDARLASNASQNMSNFSFSAPSPVPV